MHSFMGTNLISEKEVAKTRGFYALIFTVRIAAKIDIRSLQSKHAYTLLVLIDWLFE